MCNFVKFSKIILRILDSLEKSIKLKSLKFASIFVRKNFRGAVFNAPMVCCTAFFSIGQLPFNCCSQVRLGTPGVNNLQNTFSLVLTGTHTQLV
jgi:hypothetical protein